MFDNAYHFPDVLNGDACFGRMMAKCTRINKDAFAEYVESVQFTKQEKTRYAAGIDGAVEYLRNDTSDGTE